LGGKIRGGLIPPLVISPQSINTFEFEEDNMTQTRINKMLELTGADFITLERITDDRRTPEEIRLATFLAINKKIEKSPMQEIHPEVESKSHEIITDNRSKSTE
jgi:hypothetical protein